MATQPTSATGGTAPRKRKEKTTFDLFNSVIGQFKELKDQSDRLYLLDKLTKIHDDIVNDESRPPAAAGSEGE